MQGQSVLWRFQLVACRTKRMALEAVAPLPCDPQFKFWSHVYSSILYLYTVSAVARDAKHSGTSDSQDRR